MKKVAQPFLPSLTTLLTENAGLSDFLAVILKRNPSKEKNIDARPI
jgi:hypothetical protein